MRRPVLTLLTDFGNADHYVAAMKGVILGICPDAQLVDITHDVTPFCIPEAAYTLAQAWRCFPAGTVHLFVVDPGVGSARRPVMVEAEGHRFVGPDNGTLTLALAGVEGFTAREIAAAEFFRKPVSPVFHGRDLFSPVAAHLASGVPAARFGDVVAELVCLPFAAPAADEPGHWTGTVLKVDRFGNIVTNFPCPAFPDMDRLPFALRVGTACAFQYYPHYALAPKGEVFVTGGSSGYLEVSMNQGDAAREFDVSPGSPADVRFLPTPER